MYKISLFFLLASSSLFPASTLLIRTGLQSIASRTVPSAGIVQERLQSNKNSPDHVPKLDAINVFAPIAPTLWSAFYDKWGHAHPGPLSCEKKVELLKSVIALTRGGVAQAHIRDAGEYRTFFDSIMPRGGSSIHWHLLWRKFPELGICMKAVLICRNEPDKAMHAKKRMLRIMAKYGIKEELTVASTVEKRSSRVDEGCHIEDDWQGLGWWC